jgi:hypothetical protein
VLHYLDNREYQGNQDMNKLLVQVHTKLKHRHQNQGRKRVRMVSEVISIFILESGEGHKFISQLEGPGPGSYYPEYFENSKV